MIANFPDFPERLERFKEASGLSWRGLARRLRVNIRLVKRWRKGTRPDSGNLIALFSLAAGLGLLHLLLPGAGEPGPGAGAEPHSSPGQREPSCSEGDAATPTE